MHPVLYAFFLQRFEHVRNRAPVRAHPKMMNPAFQREHMETNVLFSGRVYKRWASGNGSGCVPGVQNVPLMGSSAPTSVPVQRIQVRIFDTHMDGNVSGANIANTCISTVTLVHNVLQDLTSMLDPY
jgi:hypothetical protein